MLKNTTFIGFSGGLDSGVLAMDLLSKGYSVHGICFQYGSKHNPYELKAIDKLAHFFNEKYPGRFTYGINEIAVLFKGLNSNLLKSGNDIPEGHYNDPSMKQTVIPGRNLLFASILVSKAQNYVMKGHVDFVKVTLGVHAGDHHIYPDCRKDFVFFLDQAVKAQSENTVRVSAPFSDMMKSNIVALGTALDFPFHLTRTCYKDQEHPCGECGACRERYEAFEINGMECPITPKSKAL